MKNKDIVDTMVDQLKNMEERSYREGAWEKFKAPKARVYRLQKSRWYAAAAALLCFGIAAGIWMWNKQDISDSTLAHSVEISPKATIDKQSTDAFVAPDLSAVTSDEAGEIRENQMAMLHTGTEKQYLGFELLDESVEIQASAGVTIPQLEQITGSGIAMVSDLSTVQMSQDPAHLNSHYLSQRAAQQPGMLTYKSPEELQGQTRIPLNDRFQLGLFVSPYATSNQMKVGGGLALSFKINKNLSLRTGASYNSYEVQTLKNPIEPSSTEVVPVSNEEAKLMTNNMAANASQKQMIIPNINAITGFVKSVDIPLEVKVNDNSNTFYAAAGLSYSAIFNQKREAHYVENLNQATFSEGYPENKQQAEAAVKPITRTIESAEENVNSNGFNGFVNLSIGRNIKLNRRVGLSVEPYLKVPVGQYRRADMDYTHGGIRLITNF